METIYAILHWAGHLLWLIFRGASSVLMVVSTAVVFGAAAIYAILAIVSPFLKQRSSFKRVKGQSKGPLNPYANPPSDPKI
jgi:hypothetical protein